jgi:hypothetical protein
MAVAIVMKFSGGTLDQYDRVIEKMGLTPGGDLPPGGVFHWVAKTDDGIQVVDVWETREQFEQFAQEQIGPFTAEQGMSPPELTFHDVHNHLAAG